MIGKRAKASNSPRFKEESSEIVLPIANDSSILIEILKDSQIFEIKIGNKFLN